MEEFIQYGKLLLTQYEFTRGDSVSDKEMKRRNKVLSKGEAIIIQDHGSNGNQVSKVTRKGFS